MKILICSIIGLFLLTNTFAFTIQGNQMYENWTNYSNSDYNCNVYLVQPSEQGGIYYNICKGNYTISIINSSNIVLADSLINSNITIINSNYITISNKNISKPLNIINNTKLYFREGYTYDAKYHLYIETDYETHRAKLPYIKNNTDVVIAKLAGYKCYNISNISSICRPVSRKMHYVHFDSGDFR